MLIAKAKKRLGVIASEYVILLGLTIAGTSVFAAEIGTAMNASAKGVADAIRRPAEVLPVRPAERPQPVRLDAAGNPEQCGRDGQPSCEEIDP